MAGLGLEPYIEWTEHGFKLDLTKISDQFKMHQQMKLLFLTKHCCNMLIKLRVLLM